MIQLGLGLLVGLLEGWTIGDAVYFSFVTGFTIGYGDLVPPQALTSVFAVGIGLCGILLTGLGRGYRRFCAAHHADGRQYR